MSEGEGAGETEREQEKLGLRGGRKAGPLRRGDSGYWRGCGGCGGRSALVRSMCTLMLVETWTSGLGSKPRLTDSQTTSVRSCQTVIVLKRL